jgi:hypothetical protein
VLAECEDATIEAMLGLWPEVSVHRSSIFEAIVVMTNDGAEQIAVADNEEQTYTVPGRKAGREKRTIPKKRVVREASQGDLWN